MDDSSRLLVPPFFPFLPDQSQQLHPLVSRWLSQMQAGVFAVYEF